MMMHKAIWNSISNVYDALASLSEHQLRTNDTVRVLTTRVEVIEKNMKMFADRDADKVAEPKPEKTMQYHFTVNLTASQWDRLARECERGSIDANSIVRDCIVRGLWW